VLRAALSLLLGNLTAKLTGILREVIFAALFGVNQVATAYRIAYSGFYIPIHGLVGETLSTNVIPVFRRLDAEQAGVARSFVAVLIAHALGVGIAAAFAVWLWRASLVATIAPGADEDAVLLAGRMLGIAVLAAPMYILGNALASVEAARGRYSAVSLRPVLLNVFAIISAASAWMLAEPLLLGFGILGGHALFLFWTLASTHQMGLLSWARDDFRAERLLTSSRALWRNSAPLLLFPAVSQLAILVERIVASKIGSSVLPSSDYARAIAETLVTMSAVPLSFASLASHGGGRTEDGRNSAIKASSMLVLFAFPAGFWLSVSATEVVQIAFARGAFGAEAVKLTSQVLSGIAPGLGPWVVGYYLVRVLNAELRNGIATAITTFGCIVMMLFDSLAWPHFGPLTIGLGATLSALTIFVGAMFALGLWHVHARLLLIVLIAGVGFVLMFRMLDPLIPGYALVTSSLLAAVFFCGTLLDRSASSAVQPIARQLTLFWRKK